MHLKIKLTNYLMNNVMTLIKTLTHEKSYDKKQDALRCVNISGLRYTVDSRYNEP